MLQPLHDRLDELRRSLRRAGTIRGVALLVIALVAGVAVAGGIDAWTRSGATSFRLLLTALAIAPAAWVVARVLLPPLRSKPTDVELARRVEQHDPNWGGRLAASAAFQQVTSEAGSPALQRKTTSDVDRRLLLQELPDLVDRRLVNRPVLIALGAALLAGVWTAFLFTETRTALARLSLPFAAIEWPRDVNLVLWSENGEPLGSSIQIGRGQTLRFLVRNQNGNVPDDLSLQIIASDGDRRIEPVPVVEEPDENGSTRTVGRAVLLAEGATLKFRVVGGDHLDMPFITAEVVPPPVFDQIQVTVTPPGYLGEKPVTSPDGIGSVNGVVGSSVSFRARTNKPLAAAELRIGDRPGPQVRISDDGRSVAATFSLTEPGFSSYWFRLRDRGGFENPQAPRYELRATADAIPEVTIVEPPEDLTATPDADLPVIVEATDDHGLVAVRLRFAPGRFPTDGSADTAAEGRAIPLYDGPDRPAKGSFPLVWSLEPLRLAPGAQLIFHGEATDACDLGLPHVGTSTPRTVTIVSTGDKREELLDRQAELLDGLVQARRDETRIRNAVESLLGQWEAAGELQREDRDRLAHLELEQRQISSRLIDAQQGLQTQAARARSQLSINRIDDPELAERLERIAGELDALRADALPAADRDLTAARKAAGEDGTNSLAGAKANLDTVLDNLDALLQDLGAWRDRRDLNSELNDLLNVQQELAEQTARTAAETLGTPPGQLTDEQRSTLRQLGLRQHGLADRLTRFERTVDQVAGGQQPNSEQSDADPQGSEPPPGDPALKAAAERLQQAGLPSMARAAGDSIRGNDLGEAGRLQQELAEQLDALRQALSQSDGDSPSTASLEAAAKRLEELAAAQKDIVETLRKSRDANESLPDEQREQLMRNQSELREAAAAAARQLRSSGGDTAAEAASDAAKRMSDGLQRLQRRDDEAAGQALEQALADLERAEQMARQESERLGAQLTEELVEASRDKIAALSERQAGINREVARLETLRVEQGHRSRSQLLTLRQTADLQVDIQEATTALAGELEAAPAIAFALRTATARMRMMQTALHRKETGEDSQRHGEAARQRLDQIVAALQPRSDAAEQSPQQNRPESIERSPPGELIPLVAQLQLLRDIQELILADTESLDRRDAKEKESEVIREWIEQTSRYQAELAALVRELLDEASSAAKSRESIE